MLKYDGNKKIDFCWPRADACEPAPGNILMEQPDHINRNRRLVGNLRTCLICCQGNTGDMESKIANTAVCLFSGRKCLGFPTRGHYWFNA